MNKTELEEWAIKEFWPAYKNLCKTPFVTKWTGGARGEAVSAIARLNPSEDLRQRILASIQAQTLHRKRLYEQMGSEQRYENEVKYNKFYSNRDGKTWINNKGWTDEIPSLTERQVEAKKDSLCACGDPVKHGNLCDQCFARKIDDQSGWTEKLRESYKRIPPRKEGEDYRQWAKRVFGPLAKGL
jgi:hypothetical protein